MRVCDDQGAKLRVIVIAAEIMDVVVLPEINEQILVDQGLRLGAHRFAIFSRIFAGRAGAEHCGHSLVRRRSHNLDLH